ASGGGWGRTPLWRCAAPSERPTRSSTTRGARAGCRPRRLRVRMPIDNEVYDRLGASWWDEGNPLNMLHGSCTPGRMTYFREILDRRGIVGGRALDIGC